MNSVISRQKYPSWFILNFKNILNQGAERERKIKIPGTCGQV